MVDVICILHWAEMDRTSKQNHKRKTYQSIHKLDKNDPLLFHLNPDNC